METKDIAGRIIAYLRLNNVSNVKKEINCSVLAKEWGCLRFQVWIYRERLVECGVLKKTGIIRRVGRPSGVYRLSKEYLKGEDWRVKLRTIPYGKFRKNNPSPKSRFSISRETYLHLKRMRDMARDLKLERNILDKRLEELQVELDQEKASHTRDANEIAQLELQLRESREESTKKTKRLIFDRQGVQA